MSLVLLQTTHRLKQSEEDYNFTEKNDKCRPAPHFEVGLISAGFLETSEAESKDFEESREK